MQDRFKMKIRTCDKCKKEIISKELYYKIVSQIYENKRLKQEHAGDLCSDCFLELKN